MNKNFVGVKYLMNMKIVPLELEMNCRISYHPSADTMHFLQMVSETEDRRKHSGFTGLYLGCNADICRFFCSLFTSCIKSHVSSHASM